MSTRRFNRITFDRNNDGITKKYIVYRSTKKEVTTSSMKVMEIIDPGQPHPIQITGEALKQFTTLQWKCQHKRLFPSDENTPSQVYINGVEATEAGYAYSINLESGVVKFYQPLPDGTIVTMDYCFDGIQVLDWEQPQEGVTYYGPPAQDDSTPNAPANPRIAGDMVNDRVMLNWEPGGMTGETFFYCIQALDDQGNFSGLSIVASSFLYEGYAVRGYVIERSFDGNFWEIIARTENTSYSDYGVDKVAPNSPLSLTATFSLNQNQGTGNVKLQWTNPWTDPSTASPMYRIRVLSAIGNWSPPTAVLGPIYIQNMVAQVVIRRKANDGTIPSFDGPDAITVISTTDNTTQGYSETVPDNTNWRYAVYRVDTGGNPSMASIVDVNIGDATPPQAPSQITAKMVNLIY